MLSNISDWAAVFGAENGLKTHTGLDSLKNVGTPATGYGLHAGDDVKFEEGITPETISTGEIAPREGRRRPTNIVPVIINGVNTFFNPMFLFSRALKNGKYEYIYPAWAKLGDCARAVAQMIKQGGLQVSDKTFTTTVPAWDGNAPKYVPAVDENNNPILNEDGSAKLVRDVEVREYPYIPDPVL